MCVPLAGEVARFWITRLHGPAANDSPVFRFLALAAQKLSQGDEAGAQLALDASGLTRLSTDGAALVRAAAGALGIAPLDLPWADGPRLWRTEDIAAHLPLFKEFAVGARALAKAGDWDESAHHRVPAGSPQGGQFTSGDSGAGGEKQPTASKPGSAWNGPPEIPIIAPATEQLRNVFMKLAARWLARALAASEFGPAGEFVVALESAAETAAWLHDKYPLIKAYLDPPKSLEELQQNVGKREKGYEAIISWRRARPLASNIRGS